MNASRFLPILTVGLALVTGAIVPAATPATTPLSAQRDAWVAHLVVPGDRLEIGYTVETPGVAATATLYVRSNVQRSFRALQMSGLRAPSAGTCTERPVCGSRITA